MACAAHWEVASVGTCGRCGRFCCDNCVAERRPLLCVDCLELVGDPFGLRTQPFGTMSALRTGWRLLLDRLLPVTGVALVFAVPAFVITWLMREVPDGRSVSWLLSLYDWLIGVLGQLAVLALFVAAVEGRRLPFRGAMGEATGRWGKAIWANFRQSLWVGLFTLLLVLPGIWISVMLCFTLAAVVRDDGDALQCSRELVKGRWWFVAWWIFWAGVIAYGPSTVIALVVGVGARTFHYEPPALLTELLQQAFTRIYAPVVMPALTVAAYYQLHVSTGRELPLMAWKTAPSRTLEARPSLG